MKEKELKTGIYLILNKNNGHLYVGSSLDCLKRFGQHQRDLRLNIHHNPYLQNAWNKYGSESFSFDVIMTCTLEKLFAFEQIFIDLCEKDGLYNICKIAGNTKGREITDKTRQKMRNRRHLQETKDRISQTLRGRIPWNKGLRKDTIGLDRIST